MDVMTAGVTISCAMELFERGILTKKDVGMSLNFADDKALVELTTKTGHREGFGDILAEGSLRLAERYDHPEYSMHVKGLEPAGYDPRGAQGVGLAYATSTRGACHMRSQFENLEPLGLVYPDIGVTETTDRFSTKGKASLLIQLENDKASIDSMGICAFASGYKIGLKGVVDQLVAITGIRYGVEDWMKVGERIYNLEKIFNLGAGFAKIDDTLPKRFLEEPMPEGPAKGNICKLDEMLPEYYKLRGWDKSGKPTEAKLKELNLLQFIRELEWYQILS
jgi:aldehyde:ferredoxin oxidoreductase